MEESLKLMILHGCNLAKILEQNLPTLANQPDILVKSCEEIVSVFSNVKERVLPARQMGVEEVHGFEIGGGSGEHSMGLLHEQWLRAGREFMFGEMSGGVGGDIIGGESQLDFSSASSSHRQGRRKNESDRIVKRVAAPQMGNTDNPPEDGFTWKKYGQKEILGRAYPRSYYICSHQKSHNCTAKKQVQRLDNDPFIFEVTYRGSHTCRVSSAAAPQAEVGLLIQTSTTAPPPLMPPFATPNWLSMNTFHHLSGVPASSAGMEAGSSGGGGFNDYQPVADMADAMFNSGSSSNSMDLIFSSIDDRKWDPNEEKKD